MQPAPGLAARPLGSGGGGGGAQMTAEAAEVRCPRCNSANTKFCYYNNYNLAQPRHFCRACRRYWTKGGLLRNVPVGGGCRKPKPKRLSAAKNTRPGRADAVNAPESNASSVASQPSCRSSAVGAGAGTGPSSTADTRPIFLPPPAPMFADQAAALVSLFAPPPPLPTFRFSSGQHKAEVRDVATVHAEQASPRSTAAAANATLFPVQSGGGLTADVSDWSVVAPGFGMFELTGAIAGDASLPAYWTDPDPIMYLP